MSGEIIKRLNSKDILNDFWNKHFTEFVSANINLHIWKSKRDKNATAFFEEKPVQTINPQGQIVQTVQRIKHTVAEAIEEEERRFIAQQGILRAILEIDKVDMEKKVNEDLKTEFLKK